MEIEAKSEFSYILQSNELAKRIAGHAIIIKLNALNALLLALRLDENMQGYIVVTDEFIRFSKEIIDLAGGLRHKINIQVQDISTQLKFENKYRLFNRAITRSSRAVMLESVGTFMDVNMKRMNGFIGNMYTYGSDVLTLLRRSEKFILRGDILAMQAKIEGAYAETSQEIFKDVASSLHDSIQDIKKAVSSMIGILETHLKEYEQKKDLVEK